MMTRPTGWQLEIRDEVGGVTRVPLGSGPLVIGRSDAADIRLPRQSVSREHARLEPLPGGAWRIIDLGSRGGTLVNNRRTTEATLGPADRIAISRFELRLLPPGPPGGVPAGTATQRALSAAHDTDEISILTKIEPPRLDTSHIAALSEFGRELLGIDSGPVRLQKLCQIMAGAILRARWAMALRMDAQDERQPLEQLAAAPAGLDEAAIRLSRSAILSMRRARAPVLATNFKADDGLVEMSMATRGPATAVVVCPLSEDGAEMLYVNLPPIFGSTEWLALIALAVKQYQQAEAAWAVREAVRVQAAIERDLANARLIQRSILPRGGATPGLELAWSFEPCEMVGGDCVDAVRMADGRMLLVIADVTGHGLPAALATLAVHSIVHTCVRNAMTVARMVQTLNDHLCDYLPEGRFVTMAAVALDPATGELECIHAGHHAAVAIRPDGSVRKMAESDHLPLGVAPMELSSQRDRLERDELLLLFTDGLSEMPGDDGKLLGAEALYQLVATAMQRRGKALPELAREICDRLDERRGERARLDDQTFLLARRTD